MEGPTTTADCQVQQRCQLPPGPAYGLTPWPPNLWYMWTGLFENLHGKKRTWGGRKSGLRGDRQGGQEHRLEVTLQPVTPAGPEQQSCISSYNAGNFPCVHVPETEVKGLLSLMILPEDPLESFKYVRTTPVA